MRRGEIAGQRHFSRVIGSGLGLLACTALFLFGLQAPSARSEPTIFKLDAQPLGIGGSSGIVATGLVHANHVQVHVQYQGRCVSTKLSGGQGKRRFTLVVKTNDEHCARQAIRHGWVRAFVCSRRRCVATQVRVSRFKDSDRDGLNNLLERWVYRTSPFKADSDGDGLDDRLELFVYHCDPRKADSDGDGISDGLEIAAGSNPNDPASPGPPFAPRVSGPASTPGAPPAEEPTPSPPADTTPPQTTITSGASGTVSSAKATFRFSSSESGSSFECRIDGGAWVHCTSPRVYDDLAEGSHVFEVRATDPAGNTDETPATRTWTVELPPADTTPPQTTIDSGPSGTVSSASASFDFSSSEAESTFGCNLDGKGWAPCSSPKSYFALAEGVHSFEVRATDSSDNTDETPAKREWTVESVPPDTTPPETSLTSGPSGTVTTPGATFSFSSDEPGSTFACSLDAGNWTACSSPKTYVSLANGEHHFDVRATDPFGNTDPSPASREWTVDVPPPDFTCAAGSTDVTTAAAVRSEVGAGRSVCVTAEVGNVNLRSLGKRAGVVISTEGAGSMGFIDLGGGTTDLTIRGARFRSIEMRGADRTTLLGNTIGGSPDNRVLDQLIFMPEENNDVTIEDNDIGWTEADDSGNTGYGCRCYGELNGLRFVGNKVHDIAADGFQGVGGSDVLIDRNEIGPVGANPGSSEHSDNIQLTFNGPNTRVTNNWIHHQGYYEGNVTGNSGSTYIHGGTSNSLIYENNLIEIAQGRTEICGLGTGGTSRSNITIRNNTWIEGGLAFSGFPGFEWDCDSGTGNTIEGNIAVDPDGGFAQDGSTGAATIANNLWGKPSIVTFDADGNCTSANCNPAGGAPIGYRKPSGVAW
jgi:thrombospondin type 3 repeat protein